MGIKRTAVIFFALALSIFPSIMALRVLVAIQTHRNINVIWDTHIPFELTLSAGSMALSVIAWAVFTIWMFSTTRRRAR